MGSLITPAVAIVTNERDVSADWVVRELRARGSSFVRINTERLAERHHSINPVSGDWIYKTAHATYDLSSLQSVWYRRPERPVISTDTELTDGESEYVADQWAGVIDGLAMLPCRWMNSPHAGARAESKILQLREAKAIGLRIPDTLITNSRDEALEFIKNGERTSVVKALSSSLIRDAEESRFVFTTMATVGLISSARNIEVAPFVLQEAIEPKDDVRVTVVGEHVLAARVPDIGTLDWRRSHERARFEPWDLPCAMAEACVELVRRLGLRFGAIDFALSGSGEYYFLELNQNGEWGWLQQTCGLPIAEAITDELTA